MLWFVMRCCLLCLFGLSLSGGVCVVMLAIAVYCSFDCCAMHAVCGFTWLVAW